MVGRLLGRGGMAEVYAGRHVSLDREVAIKVMNPAFHADPTFPLRFEREARAIAHLQHPNIITLYDYGEQGEIAYLVLELAPGGALEDRLDEITTLGMVADRLTPICDALQHAHDRGVVHRDLKPENVLLRADLQPLLSDFGLARIASETLDLTEAGTMLGTPYYMSPEQIMGEPADHRSDIYSLGIITYRLVAKRIPYDGRTFYAIVQQHLKDPPPSLRALRPDAPTDLDALIVRATAKRPEDRFASVRDFLAAVQGAAARAPDLALTPLAPPARATVTGATVAGPAGPASATVGGRPCGRCGTQVGANLRFCTSCGAPATPSEAMDHVGRGEQGQAERRTAGTGTWDGDQRAAGVAGVDGATVVMPLAEEPGGETAGPASAAIAPPPARPLPRRRRPSRFTPPMWVALGGFAALVFLVNGVGLWLARAGRAAGADVVLSGAVLFVYDNLEAIKSILTLFALGLAGMATFMMRAAIVGGRPLSPLQYRRYRRFHRFVGYAAVAIAFAIGLLTCVAIFGFGTSSPRSVIHSIVGPLLLVWIVVKIAVVRLVPAQRRQPEVPRSRSVCALPARLPHQHRALPLARCYRQRQRPGLRAGAALRTLNWGRRPATVWKWVGSRSWSGAPTPRTPNRPR
ncbi:MAG: serine/threonine-protein kinase [Dehalococcoidia bacterium]